MRLVAGLAAMGHLDGRAGRRPCRLAGSHGPRAVGRLGVAQRAAFAGSFPPPLTSPGRLAAFLLLNTNEIFQ